jgi:16S rRNA G966 N2-methylase RsmD
VPVVVEAMITKSFKWHPQPSSIRKSTVAAKNAGIRGAVVLDCFCGGGSHGVASILAGAKAFIGTDLEDYSFCLRKDIARYNAEYTFFGEKAVSFEWGMPASESIMNHKYDVLFIDPPNPTQIVGGATKSVIRDTGLSGSKLTKFWRARLSQDNWINKREETVTNVKEIIDLSLKGSHRVLCNCFTVKSNGFSYFDKFKDEYALMPLFESYHEVCVK